MLRQSTTLLGLIAALAAAHVSVPLSREKFGGKHLRLKRDDGDETFTLDALNNITGGGYYSEFEIGSPAQKLSFLLDTGSSDTWVNSADANLCQSDQLQLMNGFCQTTFNPDDSDTFKTVDRGGFDITYLDSRNIQGDYFEDTVTIGDAEVKSQRLGLALKSVRPTGIMGLGFSNNVASTTKYPTVVDNMVDQGFIEAAAFSLYLNDLQSDAGNILFGGIDKKKFSGKLATLPLIAETLTGSRSVTSFNVKIEGFDVKDPDGKVTVNMPNLDSEAILDSGSTISLLPDDQVQELWDEFGVLSFSDVLAPFIDCAYAGSKGDGYIFEFRFSGKTIRVPMEEMVIDAYGDLLAYFKQDPDLAEYFNDWEGVCMFGVGSTADFGIETDQFTLLGATFLRSAYVVYDLDNKQLGLAQANLNATDADVVDISKGDLPQVSGTESTQSDEDDAAGHLMPPIMALTGLTILLSICTMTC